jgi:hypothetical protein
MALPPLLLLLPVALVALGGRRRTGAGKAPPQIGPWPQGAPPQPIAQGKADDPEVGSLLEEMDNYFRDYGIDLGVIDAQQVTRLRKWGVQAIPPYEFWPRMAMTIRWGFMPIRRALNAPITITNGFRPADYNEYVGGEENSRHLYFEALDMVAPQGMANRQALIAADLWIRYGERMRMGLGVYGQAGAATNIHIDTGHRERTWNEADYWIDRAGRAA